MIFFHGAEEPTLNEVWALQEKTEKQRDQAIEERDAALDRVATLTRALNEVRVHEQEATAALTRLEDAVRKLKTAGPDWPRAMHEMFALVGVTP